MNVNKIKEWLGDNLHIVAGAVVILCLAGFLSIPYIFNMDIEEGMGGRRMSSGDEPTYQCVTDGELNIVYGGPAYLNSIIIGNDKSGSTLSVKNATCSDVAAVREEVFLLISDTMSGVWDIGLDFPDGIYASVSPGLYSTFIFSPK